MDPRIEGATLPDTVYTVLDDGAAPDNLADYTWICEAATENDPTTKLWTKSTGITPTATGFTVQWSSDDMGALSAGARASQSFILEFTGTWSGRVRKYQDKVTINRQI